jgi:hypothetical protein
VSYDSTLEELDFFAGQQISVADALPTIVTLVGPIRFWWGRNWGTPDHRTYVEHREAVRLALATTPNTVVYSPHRAIQGAWHPLLQLINDNAIRVSCRPRRSRVASAAPTYASAPAVVPAPAHVKAAATVRTHPSATAKHEEQITVAPTWNAASCDNPDANGSVRRARGPDAGLDSWFDRAWHRRGNPDGQDLWHSGRVFAGLPKS